MTLLAVRAARPARAPTARPSMLVQRKVAGPGSGSATLAPSIPTAARPIDAGARQRMETGFGRDFGAVRIHDHAAAHDSARAMGALAYATGNDIVFAAGRYQPDTPAGGALLAHELAHTVQQAGTRAKADGPLPASADRALESEADQAASAVMAGGKAPPLTRMATPLPQRAVDPPASTPGPAPVAPQAPQTAETSSAPTTAAGPTAGVPPGMELLEETPSGPGATFVRVRVANFTLPLPKGAGAWVTQAYKTSSDGGKLVFSPLITGKMVAAYKEGREDYQSKWVGNLGFESVKALGAAISASTDPRVVAAKQNAGVAKAVTGMTTGLQASGFDIDHIVEKQIGGTSIPSNLQLLVSAKNQASGRETYREMVKLVEELRRPAYRPNAKQIQISFASITVPPGDTNDPCFMIETFLRAGAVKGSEALMAAKAGTPVLLVAGGQGETVRVADGSTAIDSAATRVISGMKLTTYRRNKIGTKVKRAVDHVEAELDSRAIKKVGPTEKPIQFSATTTDAAAGVGAAVGGKAGEENKAALSGDGEARMLKFDPKPAKIDFFYPYLSPGSLTSFDLRADGALVGEGVIHPTLKFLPEIHIRYAPDLLEAVVPLDAKKFRSPIPMIRFTGGALKLALAPAFVPSGDLSFEIGPAGKPLLLGQVSASAPGGVFTANGTLKPGTAIPGISDAKGEVTYNANTGWSGKLTAATSKLPNTTVNVVLSFWEQGGTFVTKAEGGLVTNLAGKTLTLGAHWTAGGLAYTGAFDWPKPFPIVDNVAMRGHYAADMLTLEGATSFRFRQWDGDIDVRYHQKDGEPGKLSGKGKVKVETKNKKAAGALAVEIDNAGALTGHGDVTYQLTDKITPRLAVTLAKGGHLTISGEVKVGDIELFKKWPEKGGEKTLMALKPSFKIPTPIPAVNAAINIDAGVGIYYGVGPGMVTDVVIAGSFDPLEDNPDVTASLKGKFVIPTSFGLSGHVSAKIGVEVAGGAVGVDGGVQVRPKVGVSADAIVDVTAKYEKGAFDFAGKAYIDVVPKATLDVDLVASIYAGWHLLEYGWSYNVASLAYTFPQSIKINVGEIGYSSTTGMRWPKLSDVSIEPADISPLKMIEDIMTKRKTAEKPRAAA